MIHELYRYEEDIEKWLYKYKIKNYELIEDKKYGYVVNVTGDVNLTNKKLTEIKVKFNIIDGDFDCSFNLLKTLKGCPEIVNGDFWCNNNQLKNLEYSPTIINGTFYCSYNQLKTLKGCCNKIKKNFWCIENKLETLEYFPEKVDGKCYLTDNRLLKEIQELTDFNELKKIHVSIVLNKKLEKEISIDNKIKTDKIKL